MYADEGLIAEFDGSGSQTKTYGYKPGSTWTTDPLFMKVGGQYYFYHNDHLGTPQKLTSVNGFLAWSAEYESFGNALLNAGSSVQNNLRLAGQYRDHETGLHYNWNRYYDPKTGRYITADPIGFFGGIGLYAYVLNNPVNLTDPEGLQTIISNRTPSPSKPSSPGVKQPRWNPVRESNSPAMGGQVDGKPRTSGLFCTCVWQLVGYEKLSVGACGELTRESVVSIFSEDHFAYTQGTATAGGCLCANPNGELQLK
jgi:RHS repeat-associated protein